MKSKGSMLALSMMAMAAAMGGDNHFGNHNGYADPLTEEDKKRLIQRKQNKIKSNLLKKGVKEFTIDGITVMARNKKNAIRKIENIKKQGTK